MELFLTLVVGLFILFGSGFAFIFKNDKKFIDFSTSLGFGVMISLILFELIPEVIEIFSDNQNIVRTIALTIIFVAIGILILKILDLFIPDHDNKSTSNKLYHIALITSISLIIHNILEGMAVYSTLVNSIKMGIFVCLGVGVHNIVLGMVITSFFYKFNNNKQKTLLIMLLVSLSTFLGGILSLVIGTTSELIEGIILAITLGMLIYITIFELLPHIIQSKNKKNSIIGITLGIIILIISLLFE